MNAFVLHHVSIITANLERSLKFYCDVLGLVRIDRPPFDIGGAWLACGPSQLHLVDYPAGTYRGKNTIDNNDIHFALRVSNFDETLRLLNERVFVKTFQLEMPSVFWLSERGSPGSRKCICLTLMAMSSR